MHTPTRREDVNSSKTFARYVQEQVGTPVQYRDYAKLNALYKRIQTEYPKFDWQSATRIVDWAKANKVRTESAAGMLSCYRTAWKKKYLPELDPTPYVDEELEVFISEALEIEKDPEWRLQLLGAFGPNRKGVFEAWKKERLSA